jgi:hypothetical protein
MGANKLNGGFFLLKFLVKKAMISYSDMFLNNGYHDRNLEFVTKAKA